MVLGSSDTAVGPPALEVAPTRAPGDCAVTGPTAPMSMPSEIAIAALWMLTVEEPISRSLPAPVLDGDPDWMTRDPDQVSKIRHHPQEVRRAQRSGDIGGPRRRTWPT